MIFFEPKMLYRMSEDMVPEEDYMIPLGKAEVVREGKDITLLGYGPMIRPLLMVVLCPTRRPPRWPRRKV